MRSCAYRTPVFVGFVAVCAAATVSRSLLRMQPFHGLEFVSVLLLALLTSRMKVKLPGMNSNMSVNLPFLLIAVVQLSLFEALLVALVSAVAQSLPKDGSKPKPIQVLFNVSTMTVAVGWGTLIFQHTVPLRLAWLSNSLLLVMAAATVFLVQTMPVAAIISLTEGGKVLQTWSSIFQLSFPYYVLSAGITTMVTTVSQHVGWQIPLLALPVMYAVYRSYQLYFARAVPLARSFVMAKSASASS